MEEYIINKNRIKTDALNYENLRRYGIDYITRLGNKLWTDHNIHDPGITTLELLCYALTDLGYRTSFNIKDILTPRMGKGPEIQDTFIPADQILSSNPITKEDFRKWILEHIPMVRNAWIEKQEDNILTVPKECLPGGKNVKLKGFYNVTVDMEEMNFLKKYRTTFGKKPNGEFVSQATYENDMERFCRHYIRNSLLKRRNLCENITDIKILKKVYVGICVDVEINPAIKYEPIIIEIGKRVSDYISPAIPVDKKTQLNPSDIMNLIMSIDGVINVRHLHFMVKDEDMKDKIISVSDSESIQLVNNDYAFRFYNDFEKSKEESLNDIIITRGLLSFKPETGFSQTDSEALVRERAGTEMELTLPLGTNREIDEYISIQDEFPKTYKLGQEGIADNETDLRKAQRLQFKAYLLFFDQLLADYLMQLHSVKDIFSWKEGADSTYFIKNLSDEEIADFSKVFAEYEGYKEIVEPEALRLDRRNRFLNHLIARFNEEFVDYSILKFLNGKDVYKKDFDDKELIKDKKAFLRNYVSFSRDRSRAFDYTDPYNDTNAFIKRDKSVCGLEVVLYNKLGLSVEQINRNLAQPLAGENGKTIGKEGKTVFKDNRYGNYNENFGLHVYEHILLRPLNGSVNNNTFLKLTTDINSSQIVEDPYSMQITIALPGWLKISENIEFRKFVEKIIYTEVPAHISAKICWLNPYQMYLLEEKYKKFLSILAHLPYPQDADTYEWWKIRHTNALISLVEVFSSLRSIYPQTHLYNGVYGTDDYSTILNFSMLGGDDEENLWEYESKE